VQMPRMDGFALLDALPAGERPIIVFVTAFDEHAVRAFDAHALDYVLKPVDEERLHHTLARLRARRGEQRAAARYHAIAQAVQEGEAPGPRGAASSPAGDRLAVRNDGGRIIMVRIGSIDWIEARRNYVRLHLGTEWHLLRETMGRLERRLEPHGFARIHRSTIVNLDRVAEIQSRDTGELLVVLTNGLRLSLSRWFRERLEVRLAGR
jgi:two-component system LytT family response regulator